MTTIVTRAGKGSPLTHTEVDTNFTNLNTAKLETAAIPLGTAAAPSISFLSDADSGLFSPGANQVAVATNGTGRLFIDASGTATISSAALNFGTGGVSGFISANNYWGATSSDWNFNAGHAGQNFIWKTNTGTERLRITDAGLVGIGTSSASNKLTIYEAAANPIRLIQDHGTSSAYGIEFYSQASTPYTVSSITASHGAAYANPYLDINVADSSRVLQQRVRIDASGRVGIGTTSPSALLDVALVRSSATHNTACFGTTGTGVVSDISRILIKNVNTAGGQNFGVGIGGVLTVNGSNQAALAFYYDSGSATTEAARIDTSGRLLVGTIASPAHQLQVSTDSAGKPSTNTWTIVSDERIKEEIELADLDLCYEAVKSIPLKRFKWKDEVYTEEQVRDRRKLGWIAQDVEAVFPKAVGTYKFKYNQVFEETTIPAIEEELDGEGNVTTLSQPERIKKGELISEDVIEDCRDLNSDQLYAAMYGAIQKLMVKVETLEIEVASLKAS